MDAIERDAQMIVSPTAEAEGKQSFEDPLLLVLVLVLQMVGLRFSVHSCRLRAKRCTTHWKKRSGMGPVWRIPGSPLGNAPLRCKTEQEGAGAVSH